MSRRRLRLLILVAAIGAVAELAILISITVPIAEEPSGYTQLGSGIYSFESESLFGGPAWQNYTYRGVTFGFHLWCLASPAAGEICGNATEPTGLGYPYHFWDGPPSLNPAWQTWISADGHEAVQYREGGTAHILVVVAL